jgi:hypothetical protein
MKCVAMLKRWKHECGKNATTIINNRPLCTFHANRESGRTEMSILPLTNEKLARAVMWLESGPKLLDAARAAREFIFSEYRDERCLAEEGEIIASEARPAWNALCDAIAACEAIGGRDDA